MSEFTTTPDLVQSEALVRQATTEAEIRLSEVDAEEDPRADAAPEDAGA